MRRRIMVVVAAIMSSAALLISTPEASPAAASCPFETGTLCYSYCPANPTGACNTFYGRFGCTTNYAYCGSVGCRSGAEPGACCDMTTGEGCEGSAPYCTGVPIDCSMS